MPSRKLRRSFLTCSRYNRISATSNLGYSADLSNVVLLLSRFTWIWQFQLRPKEKFWTTLKARFAFVLSTFLVGLCFCVRTCLLKDIFCLVVLMEMSVQVSNAVTNVQSGTTALQNAKKHQKSSRKWMCIAIIILLIIVAVIVVGVIKPWKSGNS